MAKFRMPGGGCSLQWSKTEWAPAECVTSKSRILHYYSCYHKTTFRKLTRGKRYRLKTSNEIFEKNGEDMCLYQRTRA